ncbi:MAG: hypothetical protein JO301_05360 [Chitinophagaceae bacterium]|nr:hypothetical protein [Chitinophagaceae bacterium]
MPAAPMAAYMDFISYIKRSAIALVCLMAIPQLWAQTPEFLFYPIKGLAMEQQGFIGRTGDHLFLLNLESKAELGLYIHDMQTGEGINRKYPVPAAGLQFIQKPASVLFVSCSEEKETLIVHFLELDEKGGTILKKDLIVPALKTPVHMLVSSDKTQLLLYQLVKKSSDSVSIRGSLFNTVPKVVKQLAYSFRHDGELDMEPEVFLDNGGNTHVLVYDKPSNYRISADLTLNTIPAGEDQIVSETFNFNKVKLQSLRVFQNNECNCMQAEGLYLDGMDKTNKGLYSMIFPANRKNALAPRFIPFQPDMIRNFRRGFSATDELVQHSLQLQDIFYSDSGSFAVFRLSVGEPQKLLNPDMNSDPSVRNLQRSLAVSRAYEPPATVSRVASGAPNIRGAGTPSRTSSTIGVSSDRSNDFSPLLSSAYKKPPPLLSRASGRNAPKIIFVKLDKDRGANWYTGRSLDVFNSSADLYNRQFMAGALGQQVGMILYQADVTDEPLPVFVQVTEGKMMQEKFPVKNLLFSPIQQLGAGQFGSLYVNGETGESGVVMIVIRK